MKTIKFNTKDNLGSVWEAEYNLLDDGTLPDYGIVLKNVKHDNYNFAKDIRVMGFWVELQEFRNFVPQLPTRKYLPFNHEFFAFENASDIDKLNKYRMSSKRFSISKEKMNVLFPQEKSDEIDWNAALKELAYFSEYEFLDGLRTKVKVKKNSIFPVNCEYSNLEITQTFLFTKYSDKPSHEPTGGITATRIFPLITCNFESKPKFNEFTITGSYFRINSISTDYRFNPSLDTFIFAKSSDYFYDITGRTNIRSGGRLYPLYLPRSEREGKEKGLNNISKGAVNRAEYYLDLKSYTFENSERLSESSIQYILKNRPNQAGVFRDRDYVHDSILKAGIDFLPNDVDQSSNTRAIFHDLEKPLVYELASKGFEKNNSKLVNGKYGWDNIHWWGGIGTVHIPSAPGAFHAMHLHWRWGKTSGVLDASKRFKGIEWVKRPNPPYINTTHVFDVCDKLIDPKIGIQSLDFAILKNRNKGNLSTIVTQQDFLKQFTNGNTKLPEKIFNGDDIVLYYSPTIHKKKEFTGLFLSDSNKEVSIFSRLNGTIFIQGIFFAHEFEVINFFTGTRAIPEYGESEHNPNTIPQIWERYGDE